MHVPDLDHRKGITLRRGELTTTTRDIAQVSPTRRVRVFIRVFIESSLPAVKRLGVRIAGAGATARAAATGRIRCSGTRLNRRLRARPATLSFRSR
jgi:hypothetical protein